MGKEATGNTFTRNGKTYARTPIGGGKRHIVQIEDPKRAAVLASIATTLRATKDPGIVDMLPKLLDRAGPADAKALRTILETVERLASGKVAPIKVGVTQGATFADVAKAWTSGELAKRYPDHAKEKKSAGGDVSRLEKHITPIIGSVPMARFTIEHAENVMASLPKDLADGSRRHVAQIVNRVVGLAVYPLKMLAANPLPKGWMPRVRDKKQQAMPFPFEADKLVSSPAVSLPLRLLAGFIAREGMRHEEAEGLTWGDVDLAQGIVDLEENKTDDPRSWALRPGTARALRHWHALQGKPEGASLVFVNDDGAKLNARAGDDFREALRLVGVVRPELHEGSATTTPTGFHGLRALFVTESLARGMTESWVGDRTGHQTSEMINTYKRKGRMFAQANVTPLGDLDVVLGWAHRDPLRDRLPHEEEGVSVVTPGDHWVGHEGLEPSANGLRVHCSTN